jgi:hypothetical protein
LGEMKDYYGTRSICWRRRQAPHGRLQPTQPALLSRRAMTGPIDSSNGPVDRLVH